MLVQEALRNKPDLCTCLESQLHERQRQEAYWSPGVWCQPRQCVETVFKKKKKKKKTYHVAYSSGLRHLVSVWFRVSRLTQLHWSSSGPQW